MEVIFPKQSTSRAGLTGYHFPIRHNFKGKIISECRSSTIKPTDRSLDEVYQILGLFCRIIKIHVLPVFKFIEEVGKCTSVVIP